MFQTNSSLPRNVRRWFRGGPKSSQNNPHDGQRFAKTSRDGPRWLQDNPNKSQQITQDYLKTCRSRAKMAPKEAKMAQATASSFATMVLLMQMMPCTCAVYWGVPKAMYVKKNAGSQNLLIISPSFQLELSLQAPRCSWVRF